MEKIFKLPNEIILYIYEYYNPHKIIYLKLLQEITSNKYYINKFNKILTYKIDLTNFFQSLDKQYYSLINISIVNTIKISSCDLILIIFNIYNNFCKLEIKTHVCKII